MVEKNTLRQVKSCDLYYLKDMVSRVIDFYVRNCEEITELAETMGEDEGESFSTIMNLGLREYQEMAEKVKKVKP